MLLLAGVLLVVVLAIVLLRGGIFGGGAKDVAFQACKTELAKSTYCYTGSEWNVKGNMPLGDACKAFESGYADYVERIIDPGAECQPPSAGKNLLVLQPIGSPIEYACCGLKPV